MLVCVQSNYHRLLLLKLDKQQHGLLAVEFCSEQGICTVHYHRLLLLKLDTQQHSLLAVEFCSEQGICIAQHHRLLLLKLVKPIGVTIYCPFISTNKANGLEEVEHHIGGGVVKYICLIGYKMHPVTGYRAVCLVLAIDVYDTPPLHALLIAINDQFSI